MARSIRIEFEGAYYHVMARGNRRQAIFVNDDDRRFFLGALGEVCVRTGWRVHAWVLMGNHYHLFLETPEANLVAGMSWFQNTYTRRFNVRHREWGRLFGDRYKSILVEGEQPQYYETLLDYIHLNPVRAGIVDLSAGQSVLDHRWSSLAGGYALAPGKRARWMACEEGMKILEIPDTVSGRRKLVERLDRQAMEEKEIERCGVPLLPEEVDARCSHLRRGWYWGTQAFSEKMLKIGNKILRRQRSRGYRSANERKAHNLNEAEKILQACLEKMNLSERDLESMKSSDQRKLLLAVELRKRTVVTNGWLAERLQLKSAANVSQRLRTLDLKKGSAKRGGKVDV